MSRRAVLLTLFTIAMSATTASAQTRVVVEGRVVERGTSTSVPNATVDLDGFAPTTTSADGRFRYERVAPGGYSIHVQGYGYTPADLFVVIRRDTTLLVELDVAPVALDTLSVEARRIDVRGRVRERGRDLDLVRTEVVTNVDKRTRSNAAGRFRLRDLPAGVPVVVGIRAFGYLPLDSVIIAERDTSLTFEMRVDSLVRRMIDVQVSRLEERSRPFRSAIMPAIDRDELVRSNGTVLDVVQSRYSVNLRRVRCILIDDRQSYNGLQELAVILPDDLERIEVLERGAMLRIYTRDYIGKMLGGGVRLARPVYLPYTTPPVCH